MDLTNDEQIFSVYVVTKPLQYFNACNIVDKTKTNICLMFTNFYNAEETFEKLQATSNYWDKMYSFDIFDQPYKWMIKNKDIIQNIYIDSDYGLTKCFFLFQLRTKNIYVYEEGIGNYLKTVRTQNRFVDKIIKNVYLLFRCKDYMGGTPFTQGIFLYDIPRFSLAHPENKKRLYTFNSSFREHLNNFEDKIYFSDNHIEQIYNKIHNKKVLIYLTSWVYDEKIESILNNHNDYFKILKPHPHIKDYQDLKLNIYDYVVSGNVFIELFINQLLDITAELIVVHHNSSALLYFNKEQNLKEIII